MSSRHRQFLEHHPVIGHLYVPSIRVRMMHENHGYYLSTNSLGFRSDVEYLLPKRTGVKRIAFLGDSFTAGDGVANFDRFSDVIARLLPGTEVLNFGLTHSGTDQQYLIYRHFVAQFEPDVVVICPMVENIRRNLRTTLPNRTHDGKMFDRSKPYFTINNGSLDVHNIPVPHPHFSDEKNISAFGNDTNITFFSNIKSDLRKAAIGYGLLKKIDFVPEYNNAQDTPWTLMRAILERWVVECPSKLVIAPVPWFLHYVSPELYDSQSYRQRFSELASEKVMVCDTLPPMLDYPVSEREKFIYKYDKHFTSRGHQVFARIIFDTLSGVLS
jgi:hypothetical protein